MTSGVDYSRMDQATFFRLMSEKLSYLETHSTETAEQLAGYVTNHVLQAGTAILDNTLGTGRGYVTLNFQATCGSIEVRNPGDFPVTVASGGGGVEPIQGTGVHKLAGGTWRMCNVASRVVTIYGNAGQTVGYQAFSKGGMHGAGLTATDEPGKTVTLTGANQQIASVPFVNNLLQGTLRYKGFSVAETAAATAKLRIWDGTSATGRMLDTITLAAGQSTREYYPGRGKQAQIGIFVEIVSGAIEGEVTYY